MLIILFLLILCGLSKPEYIFIAGISLFFNVGGYIDINLLGGTGAFNLYDVGFIAATFSGLLIGIRSKIKLDKNVKISLFVFLSFSLYQMVVTIYLINADTGLGVLKSIFYHKYRIWGIFFIIPTYYFIQEHAVLYYKTTINVGLILLLLFFMTVLTNLQLINIVEIQADAMRQVSRLGLSNQAYTSFIIQLGFLAIMLGIRIIYKKRLLISYIMMLISVVLTLTRGSLIFIIGTHLVILILLKRYFNVDISKTVFKSALIFLSSALILAIIFPEHFDAIIVTFMQTSQELFGILPEGTTQSRTLFEMPILLYLFQQNILIGTGYLSNYFNAYGTTQELGLADFAVLGNLAIYGIIGSVLYLVRYYDIHIFIIRFLRSQQHVDSDKLLLCKEEALLLIATISIFYGKIFFSLINFSIDLVYDDQAIIFGLVLGILFGISNKINRDYIKNELLPSL